MLEKINKQSKLEKAIRFLICLFLFVLPWQTIWLYREIFLAGSKWEYGTLGFYATEVLLWVIICLFMWWYWRKYKFRVQSSEFRVTKDRIFVFSLLLFVFYLLLSTLWAGDKNLAWQQALRVMEAILLFLVIFIGPFEKEKLVGWLAYGAVLPALLGIWQFLTQNTFASTWLGLANHPVWQAGTSIIEADNIGRWLRAYGPFSHPNVFGGYLAMVIVLLLQNVECRMQNSKYRILLSAICCLLSVALFFTFSRTAWGAAIIGLLGYWFIVKKYNSSIVQWYKIILPIIIFLVLIFIYLPLVFTRASLSSVHEVQSIEERGAGYRQAKDLFISHPLLGAGAGNYTYVLFNSNILKGGWELQPVHNVFMLFVVEQGVVGLFLFIFVIVSFVVYQKSDIRNQLAGNCYLLSVICYLFLACFDHYLYSSYIGLMLGAAYFSLILKNDTQLLPR